MSHDQPSVVEHVVTHQPVDEIGDLPVEFFRLGGELRERFGQAVRDLHVLSPQLAHQFDVVIPRHAERLPGGHHVHHQPQNGRSGRAAIDQIAKEHDLAAGRESPHQIAAAIAQAVFDHTYLIAQ